MERLIITRLNQDVLIPASFKIPTRLPRALGSDTVGYGTEKLIKPALECSKKSIAILDPRLPGNGLSIPSVLREFQRLDISYALGNRVDELEFCKDGIRGSYIFGAERMSGLESYVRGYENLILGERGAPLQLLDLSALDVRLRYSRKTLREAKDLGCALDLLGHVPLDPQGRIPWRREDGALGSFDPSICDGIE